MNLFSFYLILAFGIALVYLSRSEHCSDDKLDECSNTWVTFIDEYSPSMESELKESELNIYCGRVEEDGKCLEDAVADCKKEHPLVAAAFASLLNVVKCQPGTDQRSMYLKILPCVGNHLSQFKKCLTMRDSKYIEDGDSENMCKELKLVLCFADVNRKVCGKDGELFAKFMEDGFGDTYKVACSGAYAIVFNVLLIACSVIIGFYF